MSSNEAGERQDFYNNGFTLIEILIAISIFAIVISTIFGSYGIVFSSAEDIEKGNKAYEMAQNCMARMTIDLSSIYATPYDFAKEDAEALRYNFLGETYDIYSSTFSRLQFFSFAHCSFRGRKESGIAHIVYYVNETANGDMVIRRSDNIFPYPEFEESDSDPILCKNVKSLTLQYFDKEGIENDYWDLGDNIFEKSLPKSVLITLETGTEETSYFFETRVALPLFGKQDKS
ncbi:MAG: type II secretion system GspH family protein [Desulfobacterales bacterium]|nr:type II secretion system GspH family protein [Desulfobacterales bacterium]